MFVAVFCALLKLTLSLRAGQPSQLALTRTSALKGRVRWLLSPTATTKAGGGVCLCVVCRCVVVGVWVWVCGCVECGGGVLFFVCVHVVLCRLCVVCGCVLCVVQVCG